MKRLMLMGASGSIGTQTIDVVRQFPDELKIVGVSVGSNTEFLIDLLHEFDIKYVYTLKADEKLKKLYPNVEFFYGNDGLKLMAKKQDYDMLVNALVGFVGFIPTLTAIENDKDVALANKETLVAGGKIIREAIAKHKVNLLPIDSEHVAILQCLKGHDASEVKRLILTASGGSFRDLSREQLADVTLEQTLNHPVWNMGHKITTDSATMMNKGFEVIEAHYLFDIPYEKIDVLIHLESIIHSMVEYNDGSIIAQLGTPDMRLMIKYALLYPHHKADENTQYLDLDKLASLNFRKMDYNRYPLVKLAKQVGGFEGNFGAILNGANDEAVSLFLKKKIKFIDIEQAIFKTLKAASFIADPSSEQIVESFNWAKNYVDKMYLG